MIRFVFFFLSFLPFMVHAGPIGKAAPSVKSKGGNVWEVVYDSGNTVSNTRTWATGADAGSLILSDVIEATITNNKKAAMVVKSAITAGGVGRIAAKTLPLVGQASLAYDIWTALRCKFENGEIKCDPGTEETPVDVYCLPHWQQPSPIKHCGPDAFSAGQKYASTRTQFYAPTMCQGGANPIYGVVTTVLSVSGSNNTIVNFKNQCGGNTPSYYSVTAEKATELQCSENQTKGVDGLCSTGSYSPKSPDEAGDHFGKHAPKVPGYADKAPGIVDEGHNNGQSSDAGSPEVSGPPSVQGQPSVTTTSKPDGSVVTTTTTPTYNITYQGNTYNVTTVNNVTTVTTNADGSTSTETTTEETSPENVAPPADPDMPAIPVLYEKKYPDGPTGVWNTRSAELLNTPIFAFLASLVPSTGDGGCPSWQLPVMYGINNTAVVDISIPCWIWSAIRAIFIVTALISCRRIIFGG